MPSRSSGNAIAVPGIPASRATGRVLQVLSTVWTWTVGIAVFCFLVWSLVTFEQFVINDRRFVLEGPPEPGVASEHFVVEGAVHVSERSINTVFLRDFGRSVYLCPLAERRRRLLGIDWVQDATVSRIWPNRIHVRIKERTPVAFVQIPAEDGTQVYGLVDTEGVMLDPQRASKLVLPVLAGLPVKEKESVRRERVRRFLRLQSELGHNLDRVSEIDVSDPDNLRIVEAVDGRAVTLMLGNQKFGQRFQNFADHYSEIRKRVPDAAVLDLRLGDRITVVSPSSGADDKPAPKGVRK